MLSIVEAQDEAARLLAHHQHERQSLDLIHAYWLGRQSLPMVPDGVPEDVRRLAQISRVNMLGLVISVLAQSLFVDGYRADPERSDENAPAWKTWQANRMDAHQTGIHRATLAYGWSYVTVLPGEPVPVIRGLSPRSMIARYSERSVDWPEMALEVARSQWEPTIYRLYDAECVYTLAERESKLEFVRVEYHRLGVCPVVRFSNVDPLNEPPVGAQAWFRGRWHYAAMPTGGEIEPLMSLQDQIDITTFNLLVAQHYQSFRQRYVLGWTDKKERVRAMGASKLWAFPDAETKVGEFGEVNLEGYLKSRDATTEEIGIVSQTPGHELTGKLVNLSAEALAAANSSKDRKDAEKKKLLGESHEQVFFLSSRAADEDDTTESAEVRWADTEARSFAATVDALGKAAQMLEVPVEELWERIPGVTQQDLARWRAERAASQLLKAAAGDARDDVGIAA